VRTTITLDDDVAAAVERVRQERGIGVSAAVNELVRRGLTRAPARAAFVQRTSNGGARLDVSNVAEVLDLLDGAGRT
jgi:Arc/MetJ family transcription regulator